MRYQILFCLAVWAALLSSCGGMHDSLEDYSEEIVYPARYDTVVGHIGFERVEIDLMKAGRIPSSQIKMGKARKTVVEYDDQTITIDSLVSWVNITGLTQPKLYRFRVYTLDEYDNPSVPQEIALIPYTSSDLEGLSVPAPRVLASPSAAVVDWPNGLSTSSLDYYGLSFSYTDKDGKTVEGERAENARIFAANLEAGEQVELDMGYKIVPIINTIPILDTVTLTSPLALSIPTNNTPFIPAEEAVLTANGVSEFTANRVAGFEKLVYPVHAGSLQDIFYFPNLKEIDLTGGDLLELPVLTYDGGGARSEVGGGAWLPYMRKVSDIPLGNAQILVDLLEAGMLEKVRYAPGTMGLDSLLAPYVASGKVELADMPGEVLIPPNFFVDGRVQDGNWAMDFENPATDAPDSAGLKNVFKTTLRAGNATFALALPREYAYNVQQYKYLKFKIYTPPAESLEGEYDAYKRLWPRFMNHLWAFGGNSDFGQEYWDLPADDFRIADEDLQKWTDVTIDLSDALGRHNRVIVINIGGEPGIEFDPAADMVYYFADFRYTKE